MKKLRMAFIVLFALCCSLFLFACAKGNTSGVRSVAVSGAKTSFLEGEDFSAEGLVVEVTYKDREVKTLTAEEYEIDSSAYQKDVAGTYTIVVTPTGQLNENVTVAVTGSYQVTVEHAFEDKDGQEICSVCGAQREIYELNDTIVTTAWDEKATLTSAEGTTSPATVASGEDYVSYGQLSIGQSATLVGEITKIDTGAAWNTPLLGIRSGAQGYITREDNWIIGTSPNGTFEWDFADGAAQSGSASATTADWQVYNVDGTTWTATALEPAEGATTPFTVVFNYREDGIMEIRHQALGKEIVYEAKVPASTYDLVVYGEKVSMHFTQLTVIRNLVMQDFKVTSQPSKTAYAEHNMFDLTGLAAEATYNRNIKTPISTYSILADITAKDKDGKDVTTSYDLRKTPLSVEMKNFRVEFGGVSVPLNGITVTESLFDKANGDYDFAYNGATFFGDDATYSYDVDDQKAITISVAGKANELTAEQKTALGTTKNYYIAFKLENAKDTAIASAECSLSDAVCVVDGKDINIILPVDDSAANFTVTAKNAAGEEIVEPVKFDVSKLEIPAVSSVQSGEAFIDVGGTFTVTYTGAIPAEDTARIRIGNNGFSIADIKEAIEGENYKKSGLVSITGIDYGTDKVVVTLKMAAPDLTSASTSFIGDYSIELADSSNVYAEETIRMSFSMKDAAANGYINVPGTQAYIKVEGKQFVVVSLNTTSDLQTSKIKTDLFINFQNDKAEATEVGFGAKLQNTRYVTASSVYNTLMNATTTRYSIITVGTFDDATNRDRGVLTAVKADLSVLGIRATNETATQTFAFEIVSGTVNGTAVTAQDEGKSVIYVVGADDKITANTVTNADCEQVTLQEGTCVASEIAAYKYEIASGNFFYFGRMAKEGSGAHTWVAGEKGDTCSACGSFKSKGEAKNTQVAKIAGVAESGITVFFNVNGIASVGDLTGDWTSPVINNSGMIITLPNLDAFSNESGTFPTGTNKFPSADAGNFYNGGAWNSFIGVDCSVAIVISPNNGITYYKNGVKVVAYKPGEAMGTSTVGNFASTLLGLIEKSGFLFASGEGIGSASDLAYITMALDDEHVMDNMEALGYEVSVSVQLGTTDNKTAYTGETPLWTKTINKGEKITASGTATSSGANVWNSPIAYLWTGDRAILNFRADNWLNGVDATPDQANGTAEVDAMNFLITKVWKGFNPASANGADWAATLVAQYKKGAFATTVTWDWTDESKIVVSYAFTWGEGAEAVTFNQSYEVTAQTGKTLLDTYSIGLGVDSACFTVTQVTVEAASATPAE